MRCLYNNIWFIVFILSGKYCSISFSAGWSGVICLCHGRSPPV